MALNYKGADDQGIPKDAVTLTEDQALIYQWKIINDWKNKRETWALENTSPILFVMTSLSAIYINGHYRSCLRLGRYARLSTYLPTVVIPSILSLISQKLVVQRELILKPLTKNYCPICLQTRAAALQGGFGVIYPTLLAPMAAFMFASQYFTYNLPSISKEPMAIFKLWQKFTRPILPTLSVLLAVEGLAAMYLTGKQLEQFLKIQETMQKLEHEAEQIYLQKQQKKHQQEQQQKQAISYFNSAPEN